MNRRREIYRRKRKKACLKFIVPVLVVALVFYFSQYLREEV